MRPSLLTPLLTVPIGWMLGSLMRPEPTPATLASTSRVPVQQTSPRCPSPQPVPADPGAPAASPVPRDWDPLDDEARLWREASALATEVAHGEVLAVDCARWPCITVLILPVEDRASYEEINEAMFARWPGARLEQSGWEIDGVEFDTYTVTSDGESLDDDLEREVRLRRIAIDLEVDDAARAWAGQREAEAGSSGRDEERRPPPR